ncbi:MAG TPA: HisA/HisF-related TIM barrel protein [Gemmatimonadaceae bacterium]|jgi:phosphoribosylformimino-5-aminoimidazole carboxamide ribonucleotide (ProFAR) isomerase|nr:HisA/HisF-related TIM barrel protein [Gemmatimonadaceae bacterium]
MIAIPTVDLRNGACANTPASKNGVSDISVGFPIGVARALATDGFRRLQIVDRDWVYGSRSNTGVLEDVVRDGAIEIQVGGGVESLEQIERLADVGASRVVLGGRALDELDWLAESANLFPGLLVVSTDVRERRIVMRGWVRGMPVDILDLAEDLAGVPLGGLLISSVHIEGQQHTAADLALLEDVVEACEFPVMTAGGVASVDDLRALEHRGIAGAVLGTILFSGALDPRAVAQEFGG